jgi:hypothetical protein
MNDTLQPMVMTDTTQSSRRVMLRGLAAALAAPALVSACADDSAARAGIRVLPTPRGGTVPALKFDPASDMLHLLYLDGQDVFHVESRDGGASFGAPRRVNDKPRFANGGSFRGPELAIGSGGSVHAIWYSRAWENQSGDKSLQGVMYTRCPAGGEFEPSRNLGVEPSDGYSIAALDNQVALAWHNGEQLKLRRSDDGGQVFAAPVVIDALPCECCATSLQLTPQGAAVLTFRDRAADQRDMYLAWLDRSAPARKLKLDARSWVIKACPISGSAVLLGPGHATTVWERDGRILLSRVALDRWQRSEPLELGGGKFPFLLDNAKSTLAAWVDGRKLRWKRFDTTTLRALDEGSVARAVMDRAAGAVSRGGEFVLAI